MTGQRYRHRRRAVHITVALATAAGSAVLLLSSSASTSTGDEASSLSPNAPLALLRGRSARRSASVALPHGGCRVTPATGPTHRVEPTFTASYPGSGAKMVWNLVEALTGYVTGDEWSNNGHKIGGVVTVKTHYPHSEGNREFIDKIKPGAEGGQIKRAILLLRNPKNAIPSYLNFLYEVEHDLEGHSTRAPLEEWIAFRNQEFDAQLRQWREHAEYWLDRYPKPEDRLILSFEGLTDDRGGPIFTEELARFLDRGGGVPMIYRDSVPCVWETVVKYRGEGPPVPEQAQRRATQESRHLKGALSDSDPSKPESRRKGRAVYPYTEAQLDAMIAAVLALKENRHGDFRLAQILDSYVNTINGVKDSLHKK